MIGKRIAQSLLALALLVGTAHAQTIEVPNDYTVIVELTTSDGTVIDSRQTGDPNPVWEETPDSYYIGLAGGVHSIGDRAGIPYCNIGTRDNEIGSGDAEVTAYSDGALIGSLTFTVNVVAAGTPINIHQRIRASGNPLVLTVRKFVPKP